MFRSDAAWYSKVPHIQIIWCSHVFHLYRRKPITFGMLVKCYFSEIDSARNYELCYSSLASTKLWINRIETGFSSYLWIAGTRTDFTSIQHHHVFFVWNTTASIITQHWKHQKPSNKFGLWNYPPYYVHNYPILFVLFLALAKIWCHLWLTSKWLPSVSQLLAVITILRVRSLWFI